MNATPASAIFIAMLPALAACSAQAEFPDTRAPAGLVLTPEDYTGAFVMVLDSRDAAEHNAELGMPVDVSLRPEPGEGVDLNAAAQAEQSYHVELTTEGGAVTRCTVQEDDRDGSYAEAICRREGDILQIVVSGTSTGRLVFELAKPEDGGPLSGRGFLQHPVLPVSPSIGSVTLTPAETGL